MVTAKVKFQKMDSKQDAGELVSVNLFIGHLEATVSNEVLLASFHQSLGCYINQKFCTKRKFFTIQQVEGPSYEAKNGLFIKIFSERKYSDQNNENIQLLCSKYQIRWRYCISFATLSVLYPQVSCNIDGGRKQPPPRQLYIKPVKQNLVNTSNIQSLFSSAKSQFLCTFLLSICRPF